MNESKRIRLEQLKREYDKKIEEADEDLQKKPHNSLDGGKPGKVVSLMIEYEKKRLPFLTNKSNDFFITEKT